MIEYSTRVNNFFENYFDISSGLLLQSKGRGCNFCWAEKLNFLKGSCNGFDKLADGSSWEDKANVIRQQMAEVFDSKNLSFLIGSGCSSLQRDGTELGIPTMKSLAEEFQLLFDEKSTVNAEQIFVSEKQKDELYRRVGINLSANDVKDDLEEIMTILINASQFCRTSDERGLSSAVTLIDEIVIGVQKFVLWKCTEGCFSNGNDSVVALYQKFYQSLTTRSRGLAPPWVFTTNYDLFNEYAMDRLGIPYSNGFSGTVERIFNPATYRLALAEQLDITSRRWTAVDGFVRFCKLHGSVNWVEEETGLFPVRETPNSVEGRVMIYPTPLKQKAILGSPYSDMLREFQRQVVQDQSVLVVMGFGFRDEHINNIIFQCLTLPSFKLVAFMDSEMNDVTRKLADLGDPRIWFIWGEGEESGKKVHHYDNIVNHLLPTNTDQKIDQSIKKARQALLAKLQDSEDG